MVYNEEIAKYAETHPTFLVEWIRLTKIYRRIPWDKIIGIFDKTQLDKKKVKEVIDKYRISYENKDNGGWWSPDRLKKELGLE